MIPWKLLDTSPIPGSGEMLRLMQRGTEFAIKLGQNQLMNSRLGGSEEALATLTCERIAFHSNTQILIGGLGMGFTLRAALARVPPQAKVVVAELVPAVVSWARGPMLQIFGQSLRDSRVEIRQVDVFGVIGTEKLAYDAILLDVDNGPEGLTRESNDRLYNKTGLHATRSALRPGGILAVWSASPNPAFTERLRAAGFSVEQVAVRANGSRGGARHQIWLATRGRD